MFRWLLCLFSRKLYRVAQSWETPPDIRKKMRCAVAGIDPATVQEPPDIEANLVAKSSVSETRPQVDPEHHVAPR